MNLVFLTSKSTHHYYLINEIHKTYPVSKVFFQTIHEERTSTKTRLKRLFTPKQTKFIIRRLISHMLFWREKVAQPAYEKKMFFGQESPHLNPEIPSQTVYTFNDPQVVKSVRAEEPDLIIVFGTEILKGEILDIAKKQILNIHRDILPKYRGGGLPYWVFYKEDFDNLGVTLHICAKKLDAGHIVGQKRYRLEPDDRIFKLRYKTTRLAVDLLKEVIEKYKSDSVEYTKQPKTKLWTAKRLTIGKEIRARKNFDRYIKSLQKKES